MRLGVSAKVFLAYAVLLVAFAVNSIFGFVYFHRGWQEMQANQHRLQVQYSVDLARQSLQDTVDRDKTPKEPSDTRALATSRVADPSTRIVFTRTYLEAGQEHVDDYLATAPDSEHRAEFLAYRAEIDSLHQQLKAALEKAGEHPQGAVRLAKVADGLRRLSASLRTRVTETAREVSDDEHRSMQAAVLFGGLGFLIAIGAAILILRTLRPLQVLRLAARRIAGGEYTRRVGLTSRDEIGDLAREFDAMAGALEEREQRLIRSERLATVGRMAAQITHEIRNPLASIGLYVELLAEDLGTREQEARGVIASIGKEVDRLSEITESYLRFVRLPRPKTEREDPGALVSSVMEFARAELVAAGITLDVQVAPDLPEVAVDENQIRQALLNLVRNAREAMTSGGKLDVRVERGEPGEVRVLVADDGPGIAPENIGKIFDPFFSTKAKGTGLGLALVQQIAAEHGGRIEVRGRPERGTVFSLVLPAVDARPSVPTDDAVSGPQATEPLPAALAYPKAR